MKKLTALILIALMLFVFASCGAQNGGAGTDAPTEAPTEPAAPAVPLGDRIDAFLDKYLCVTHGKLDIIFNYAGASFTPENLAAVIRNAAGLDDGVKIAIDESVFAELLENYQGAGDGGGGTSNGFFWPDPLKVVFSDETTGETVEKEISFSFRKCLPSSDERLFPNGVPGTCPEDANQKMKVAYVKLMKVTTSEDAPQYEGYEGEYTEEAVEAFFRDLTGLTDADAYGFCLVGFDPETRGEPFFALFFDKNAPDGRFDPVWIETAFK